MKITDLTLIPASKYLFVKIITDTGISGIGEVGVWGFIDAAAECLKKFRGYLVGKDPFRLNITINICTVVCIFAVQSL